MTRLPICRLPTAALLAATLAHAEPPPRLVAIDGDTVHVLAADGRVVERLRLIGIDAPEIGRAACRAEFRAAEAAKARLGALLAEGPVVIVREGRDRFGRTLARLTGEAGRDLALSLLAERHAVPWHPGRASWRERRRHWCPEVKP